MSVYGSGGRSDSPSARVVQRGWKVGSLNPPPLSKEAAITQVAQEYVHLTAKSSVTKVRQSIDAFRRNNFLSKEARDYLIFIYNSNTNVICSIESHVEEAALTKPSGLENCVMRQAFELWTHCKEMNKQIGPVIHRAEAAIPVAANSPRGGGGYRASPLRHSPLPKDLTQIPPPRRSGSPSPLHMTPRRAGSISAASPLGSLPSPSRLPSNVSSGASLSLPLSSEATLLQSISPPDPSDVVGLQKIRDRFVQMVGLLEGQRKFHTWISGQSLDWLRQVRSNTQQSVATAEGGQKVSSGTELSF